MRRFACVGDTLIPGGGVILPDAGRAAFFDDHQPALVSGLARCDACKSIGIIAKAGGPRRLEFMGEIALDGDIVLCGCPTPPRIAATLAGDRWYEDMDAGDDSQSTPADLESAYMAAPEWESYDERVVATGPHDPIADMTSVIRQHPWSNNQFCPLYCWHGNRIRLLGSRRVIGNTVLGGKVTMKAIAATGGAAGGILIAIALWRFWTPRCNELCPDWVVLGMFATTGLAPLLLALAAILATVPTRSRMWRCSASTSVVAVVAAIAIVLTLAAPSIR